MGAARIGRRRRFTAIIAAVLIAVGIGAWRLVDALDGSDGPADVTLGSTTVGRPIPSGFIGLSLEFDAIPAYAGSDPAAINPVLVQLIRNLTPGQQPVLRIGGDSTDRTWWPVPGMSAPAGVSYALNDGWLATVRGLAAALGARLILGVNLAADNPAIATAEAHAFESGIGSRYIEALEVGNEPDLYGRDPWYRAPQGAIVFARDHSYSFQSFLADFGRIGRALQGLPLTGPAFAWLPWMSDLGRFIAANPALKLVTFHRYPLRRCNQSASSRLYGSIANLLSGFASGGLAQPVARYAAVAHAHQLSFRIDEMNSVSCHGKPGVSNSFASSLWALNTLFELARAGVDGVNFHTFPGASYELFSFAQTASGWTASVKPEYYGLDVFAQAAPPGARLLATSGSSGSLRLWATLARDGTKRVVVINEDARRAHEVTVRVPGSVGVAADERLLAPGAAATGGVTLGGQSFGTTTTTGKLAGATKQQYLFPSSSRYVVAVPPASAVELTLIPGLSSGGFAR